MPGYDDRSRHRQRRQGRNQFDECRRMRFARPQQAERPPRIPTLAEIAAPENLIGVYYHLKRESGHAPGPDGVSFGDLSHREVCEILRALSQELLAGRYVASRRRCVKIAKPDGGFRILSIRSLLHRIVCAALHQAMSPNWENLFCDSSFGFRPGRSTWQVITGVEYAIEQGFTVLVQDDIRQAFDNVRIDDVLEVHRQQMQDEQLLSLVEAVLRDPHRQNHIIGIDQGGAYSPLALNVSLHVHLDTYFQERAIYPFRYWRYADNLLAAYREVPEGWSFLDQIRQQLQPLSLSLKGADGPPVDLRRPGTEVTVLGLVIKLEGESLHYGIPEMSWQDLEEALLAVHEKPSPTRLARETIRGWVEARGPVFESAWEPVLDRVLQSAARNGHREIAFTEVRSWMQSSRDRWRHLRDQERQRLSGGTVETRSPTLVDAAGHHVMSEAGSAGTVPADLGCFF